MSAVAEQPALETLELPPPPSIMERALLLVIHKGKFTNSRKTKIDNVFEVAVEEAGADPDAVITQKVNRKRLSASKKLLKSDELKAINSVDSKVTKFVKQLMLPSSFKSGMYLVPIDLIPEIVEGLKAFQAERLEKVAAFRARYNALVQEARDESELGDLFDLTDYPSLEDVEELFTFGWEFVSYSTPGTLKQVKESIFKEEQEKAAGRLQSAQEACVQVMRAAFSGFVDKLRERLTPEDTVEGPKKKVFKKSSLENLTEFLKTFPVRNIANDTELAKLVAETADVLEGVDPERLRSDDALRESTLARLTTIATSLPTVPTDRGSRKILLED